MSKTKYEIWYPSEITQRIKYGMTVAEIAEQLNVSPERVSQILQRALRKLRENSHVLAEYL